jgi:hypothetical protein
MVTNLRSAFKELVDESLWMDEETQVTGLSASKTVR